MNNCTHFYILFRLCVSAGERRTPEGRHPLVGNDEVAAGCKVNKLFVGVVQQWLTVLTLACLRVILTFKHVTVLLSVKSQ